MPIRPVLGTAILVVTILFSGQAQAVKVDTTVNDWEFAFSRSAKTSQPVRSGQDLMLVNRHIGIPFGWGRTGSGGGINLKWATGKRLKDFKRGKKLRLVRIVSRRKGQLRYGDRVAVYIHHRASDGHYLKYKKRSNGINLVWSKKPRYEFELRGGTKGLPVWTQNPLSLYNHVERDTLIYCERWLKKQLWVKWSKDCKDKARLSLTKIVQGIHGRPIFRVPAFSSKARVTYFLNAAAPKAGQPAVGLTRGPNRPSVRRPRVMMHASKRGRRVQRAQVNLKKQTKKTLPLQRWQITRARGGYFYIGVKGKRLRLTAIGDRVDLGPARRGDAQLWAFVPANFTDYFIVSKATGKAIDFRSPTSTKIKLSGGFKRPFKVTPLSNLKAGHFLARLRVLTHNIYGKSPLKCKFRARRLGKWIANQKPAYDFIGLQEYYESKKLDPITCSGKYFHKEVTRTGQFKSKAQFYRYRPRRRAATNGGLALLTPHKIITKREYNWGRQDGVVGKLAALEGVIFARVQAAPKVQIDFYVLHLWSGTPRVEERRSQLRRLAKIIHKNSYGGGRKGQNPVVVMGDFNIGGPPCHKQKNGKRVICGNPGHDDIVTLLRNPRDIWLEFNPGKEGLTNDGRKNRVDADEEPGWGRIDYIFVLEDPYFSQSPLMIRDVSTSVIPVSVVKVKTEKRFNVGSHSFTGNFDCPEKFKTCKMAGKSCCPDRQLEVSDHYGIEAFLDIFRRQK